ncbi:MAG: hypothetical protein Solivirus4_33, partial [Solivirus sp.]
NYKINEVTRIKTANFQQISLLMYPTNTPYTQILIDIPGSIVKNQKEYVTNLSGLVGLFQQQGYSTLLPLTITDEETFLTDEEIQFTKMFSYAIQQKN